MAATSIRWGRVVLGGFVAELILFLAVIPIYALGGPQSAVTVVAVAGSFLVFLPVAWWLCRPVMQPILHGSLMGAAAAAMYLLIQGGTALFVADAPAVPFIYYVAHVLKLAGGATGGWLAQQQRRKLA
jgi:hypothetical protein